MMTSKWRYLAMALRVSIDELARMIGYRRQGLYNKKPNPSRDRLSKRILMDHSDRLYAQDVANAESNRKRREAEIEKIFGG